MRAVDNLGGCGAEKNGEMRMSVREQAYIYGGVRTPYGKYRGRLSSISAVDLGAFALKHLAARFPDIMGSADGLLMGMNIQAGYGTNPARTAGHRAGLPLTLPSITLNNACLAGIDCAVDATRRVRSGEGRVYVVGGMHSSSRAPTLEGVDQARTLAIHTDGVICPISNTHVGELSDHKNAELGISRQRQDEWALESHRKAVRAQFVEWGEIEPIAVDGEEMRVDESIRRNTSLEALAGLSPVFTQDGTITAGNAPPLADGAAAAIIANAEFADIARQKPLARIVDWSYSAGPDWTLHNQPADATRRVLAKQGLSPSDIDLYEINEAFAGVVLAALDALRIPPEIVNVNGGSIAIGHPDTATATRQLLTLARELKRRNLRRGIATLCGGGGQGIAILVERD
ncbi:putative acetyl-CoA acetyltransferase FadA [Cupriavidus sp. TA19]|uniref:thiolase family protein n=1 Tax=Cupriavidus sp. TA19 TaxID=701108 RepID=UPI00272944DC|nr:thiolase family protein [Cupriavidus sp. TA19]GLC94276.1 putative acetyl-CoA acetyltransferase FadA [Cupriavidus sp. TA19]